MYQQKKRIKISRYLHGASSKQLDEEMAFCVDKAIEDQPENHDLQKEPLFLDNSF